MVLPRRLRDQLGLEAGPAEVTVDGAGLRIEAVAGDGLTEEQGLLVVPAGGGVLADDQVRRLRHADQG